MMKDEISRIESGKTRSEPLFKLDCLEVVCEHGNVEHTESEDSTNIVESMWCLDCGNELDLPVKDYDILLEGK